VSCPASLGLAHCVCEVGKARGSRVCRPFLVRCFCSGCLRSKELFEASGDIKALGPAREKVKRLAARTEELQEGIKKMQAEKEQVKRGIDRMQLDKKRLEQMYNEVRGGC
jgi:predicted nuclease with TOPRIM domain